MMKNAAIGAVVAALPAVLTYLYVHQHPINHDTAWYLVATQRWLDGAQLYTDIVEVNPPLQFYLTVPAIYLKYVTDLNAMQAQFFVFSVSLFLILFWCWTIIIDHPALSLCRRIILILGTGGATVLPAMTELVQRDQLFAMFALPWLFDLLPGGPNLLARRRILPAFLAAIGICLKPFFLILPLLMVLWEIWRARSLVPIVSASYLTMFGVGVSYVVFVALVHPAYFSEIVPLARSIYGAYSFDQHVIRVFAQLPISVVTAPLALMMFLLSWKPPGTGTLIVATIAGAASYFLQWTGFEYHLLPFQIFGLLLVLWILIHEGQRRVVLFLGTPILVATFVMSIVTGPFVNVFAKEAAPIIQGHKSYLTLSSHVSQGAVAGLMTNATWSSRFPAQWLVPGVVNELARTDCAVERDRCDTLRGISRLAQSSVIEDIERYSPEVILVDRDSGYFDQRPFDWIAYFSQHKQFAQVMSSYTRLGNTGRFLVFERQR